MSDGPPLRLIAFAAVDLSLPQGHALHVRGLFDALTDRGNVVDLITPRPASKAPPVRFRKIEIPIIRYRVLGLWSFELAGGARLLFQCLRRRPVAIYARQDLYTVAPAMVSRLLRIPLISEVNASIADEMDLWGNPLAKRIVTICERFSLRRASAILVMASPLRGKIAGRLGIDPSRIHVVPIGTHLPPEHGAAEIRTSLGISPVTFLVGFVGNLAPVQGVDVLIEAVGAIRDENVRLLIVGAGVEEESLRQSARRFGERIRFLGGTGREESDRIMAGCQILVAPYHRSEYERIYGDWGQTSKVLSYLAANRPILVTDIPSYRWVEEMRLGGLVPAGDAISLARAIEEWYARWRAEGAPIEGWPWCFPGPGRNHVESVSTWDHVAGRTEEILRGPATAATPPRRSRAR